jgi:3-oxocholest-4-en-26-oate---CoA ligase
LTSTRIDETTTNEATIWEAVADAVGDAPAVIQGDRVLSWTAFEDRASRLASALAELGVGPGGRVAIDLYNCPEYLEVIFATFKLRAVPINVNYRYRERELTYIVENSHSSVVVFHGSLGARVAATAEGLGRPIGLIEIPAGEELIAGALEYEALVAAHAPAPRIERSSDDEFILYTGGTTGLPRGVVWSHASLFGMQRGQFAAQGLPVPETLEELGEVAAGLAHSEHPPATLTVSPLMHGTAVFTSMGTFVLGGRVVLCQSRSLDADEICTLVGRYGIRTLAIVGDVFGRPILEALDAAEATGEPYDLSSLTRIHSVGVTWSAPVKQGLLRHGDFVLADAVAATEGGGFASSEVRRGDDVETAHFRLGPNGRVVDENDRDVVPGSGTVGLLAAAGSLPKGYLDDPEKTARTFRVIGGVRHVVPGDMATIEADGTVVLLGRSSEVVNTGGEKVFVEEVEQVIATHPEVRDVVVVGVPDERWGHRIAALVAVTPGAALAEREVVDFVGEALADHKRPRQVLFVDEVQRSPSGKADRNWAKDLAARQPSNR